ncbi:MAG: ATPase [Daejeonella sp.]|nr:ATPase [Daejeonella sp.]
MIATEPDILSVYAQHVDRAIFAFNINENQFEYLSPGFEQIFRRDRDLIDPASLIQMIHKDDQEYLKRCFDEMQKSVNEKDIEFRIHTFLQKDIWIRLKAFVPEQFREPRVIIGCAEDITAIKESFYVIKKYSDKKNSVLNILSHDLASPLGSIQNISALLTSKLESHTDKAVQHLLMILDRVAKKGTNLIQNFVKEEFIESANSPIIPERVDIVDKFKQIIEDYKEAEKEIKITFHFNVNQDPIFIHVDETKFMQVINNLLSNSIKFTPAGGQIFLSIEDSEQSVLIQVRDTGIGIPKRYHARLFEKYNEARRTGINGEPSVGLGMSIIKTILDWHQAKIWFESTEGIGTVFYIEVPKKSR